MPQTTGSGSTPGGGQPTWPTLPRRYSTPTPMPAPTPRRRRRLVLLLCVALVALAAAAAAGWLYFQTTPAYTLALLADAAQRDDAAAFDSFVDADQVADGFVRQAVRGAAGQQASGLAAALGGAPDALGGGADALVPSARALIKRLVSDEIRREVKEEAGGARGGPFVLVALATRYRARVEEDGDTARALLEIKGRPVELTLRRADARGWRVVAVKDDALAARVAETLLRELPRSGPTLEGIIREGLNGKTPDGLPTLPLLNGK